MQKYKSFVTYIILGIICLVVALFVLALVRKPTGIKPIEVESGKKSEGLIVGSDKDAAGGKYVEFGLKPTAGP